MEIEQFAPARDFFYLTALLFGAGLGCILNRFRRRSTARFRDLTVAAGFCFFSGSLAALTAAIIYSNWMIFYETSLYLPLGIVAMLLVLAFRFPRAAGFPLILVSGIFVVWMGYACLRFPVIDGTARGSVMRDGNGLVHVRLVSSGADTLLSFQPSTESPEFRALSFSFPKPFPLAGGVSRGLVAEIMNNNESLYTDPRLGKFFFPGQYPWPDADNHYRDVWERFFSFHETLTKLDTKTLVPGKSLTVLFEGRALTFR